MTTKDTTPQTRFETIKLGDLTWEIEVPVNATRDQVARAGAAAFKAGALTPSNAIKGPTEREVPLKAPDKDLPPSAPPKAPPAPPKAPTLGQVVGNKMAYLNATGGVADLGNGLLGASEWLVDKALRATGLGSLPEDKRIGGGMKARGESLKAFAADTTGYDPNLKPQDTVGRIAEAAVEGAYPTNLLMLPGKATTTTIGGIAKLGGAAVQGASGGAGAQAALETVNPTNAFSAVATGVTGGVTAGTVTGAGVVPRIAARAGSKVAAMFADKLPKNVDEAKAIAQGANEQANRLGSQFGQRRVDAALAQAVKQDPQVVDNLRKQEQLLERTGIDLPTVNVNNPLFNSAVGTMVSGGLADSQGNAVRASQAQASSRAQQQTRGFQQRTFGDANEAEAGIAAGDAAQRRLLDGNLEGAENLRKAALERVDQAINETAKRGDVGLEIEQAFRTKEKMEKQRLGQNYEQIADMLSPGARDGTAGSAQNAGKDFWTVDARTMDQVRDNVKYLKETDFMNMFNPTERKIVDRLFDPQAPLPGFHDLDIIKQAANRVKMGTTPGTIEREKATQFIDFVVNPLRNNMPEHAKQLYAAADLAYSRAMGVEQFGAQALKDMDSARYYANITQGLGQNPEAIKQYINVMGPQGKKLAGDAVLAKLRTDLARLNGAPDESWYSAWVRKNQDVLDEVPDVKEQITNAAQRLEAISKNATEARLARADYLEKDIIGRYNGDAEKAVLSLLESPQSIAAQRLRDLAQQGPKVAQFETVQAMRSVVTDAMIRKPELLEKIVTDSTMKGNLDRLMGPTFIKDLDDLKHAVQNSKNKFENYVDNKGAVPDKFLDEFGITAPTLISRLMDRITSMPIIGANIARTVVLNKSNQAFQRQMADFLAGSQGRKALLERFEDLGLLKDGKVLNEKELAEAAMKIMKDSKLLPITSGLLEDIKNGAKEGAIRGSYSSLDEPAEYQPRGLQKMENTPYVTQPPPGDVRE